ncbi:WD40-repeat-containing domain protein [Dunaliella salina]|uniref:WD40-repeat-containing domain protein n=1 Tax=Dunaliella salina TaxID=3046 RepID=A0ABQ7G1J9_DUNSA|nr:WD40-repeat-containing domain protein [Dunaliella salina]|eukprot:KAF5828477.1 WD40-repeat-containing domain protein [Dunaliella salina]
MTSIPPDPIGAGHLTASLQLEGPELHKTLDLLRAVASSLYVDAQASTPPIAAAPAGPTTPPAAPSASAPMAAQVQHPMQQPLPNHNAASAPILTGPAPAPIPPATAVQPVQPQPAPPAFMAPRPPFQQAPPPASLYPSAPNTLESPYPPKPMHPTPFTQPTAQPPPQPSLPFPSGPAASSSHSAFPVPAHAAKTAVPTAMPGRPGPMPGPIPGLTPVHMPGPTPGLTPSQTPGPRPAAAAAPPPPPSVRQPPWEAVWTTDPADHNNDPVHALAYCPTISGLPGGDGHAGWLISSSRHTLNLWEATPGGGAKSGEPSIMMMHSQLTDFLSTHLAVEESLSTMFAVSLDTKAASECVSVHSLSADTGILPYKYRIVPPTDGGVAGANWAGAPGKPAPKQRGLHRVASLHPLGRYLRNHIVAAHGPRVLMYEREWKALEGGPQAAVTALQANALSGGLLFTGATDGSVAIWNLTDRPGAKVRDLKCEKHVSALQLVSDTTLVTSSMDGKVLLWDMRRPAAPFRTVIPDGSPALQLDVSPAADCMAVATAKGVYSIDLLDGGGTVTPISQTPLARPPLALSWNWSTNEVYVAGHNGAITVYRQQL